MRASPPKNHRIELSFLKNGRRKGIWIFLIVEKKISAAVAHVRVFIHGDAMLGKAIAGNDRWICCLGTGPLNSTTGPIEQKTPPEDAI